MAINKNHEFEDLNGVKCAIVERNITQERVQFLKNLLNINGFTVIVTEAAPPKTAKPLTDVPLAFLPEAPTPPTLYTLGVTNVTFNATNAIFGRLLKTRNGHVVSQAYWNQTEKIPHDQIPYYEHTQIDFK